LLVRNDIFQELGGFDTRYMPAYYEDTDLCMNIREKGHRVLFPPKAVMIHHHEYSSSPSGHSVKLMQQNYVKFAEKWRGRLQGHFEYSVSDIPRARDRAPGASILVVDDRVPTPDQGSGYPRAYALIKFLAELDCKVTLFPAISPVPYQPFLDELQHLGVEVMCETHDFAGFCAERRGLFDAVLVSRPHNLQKRSRGLCTYR
jgi:O-antigen biosynthesis protein